MAAMIHDLRNPLNTVLGSLGLISTKIEELPKQKIALIKNAQDQGEILMIMVNNILDSQKLESGKFKFVSEPIEMRKLVLQIMMVNKTNAAKKKLEFSMTINPRVPRFLLIDKARVIQVLMNIVSNAIKFTSKGFVQVIISWEPKFENIQDEKKKNEVKVVYANQQQKHLVQYNINYVQSKECPDSKALQQQHSSQLITQQSYYELIRHISETDLYEENLEDEDCQNQIIQTFSMYEIGKINNERKKLVYENQEQDDNDKRQQRQMLINNMKNYSLENQKFRKQQTQNLIKKQQNLLVTSANMNRDQSKPDFNFEITPPILSSLKKNEIMKKQGKLKMHRSKQASLSLKQSYQEQICQDSTRSQLRQKISNQSLQQQNTLCFDIQNLMMLFQNSHSTPYINSMLQTFPSFEDQISLSEMDQEVVSPQCIQENDKKVILYQIGTEKQGTLKIEIKDSGCGISPENQKKLFQPYQQANRHINKKYGGTGLGLWICKQIVEKMNGNIQLESNLGEGSKFKISIPVVLPEKQNKENMIEIGRGINVLVLTESFFQNQTQLLNLGCKVYRAETIEQALQMFKQGISNQQSFDLILIDISLKELDGLAAAQIFKNLQIQEKLQFPVSIFLMTKDSQETKRMQSIVGEDIKFLNKNFNEERLSKILQHIQQKKMKTTRENQLINESLQPKKILITDDDEFQIFTFQSYAEEVDPNIEVLKAQTGYDALKLFQENLGSISLVFLDKQLPDYSGIYILQQMRLIEAKRQPSQNKSKIIMVSGDSSSQIINKALENGADKFYVKPFSLKDFKKVLNEEEEDFLSI